MCNEKFCIEADPSSEFLTSGLAELYVKTGRIRDAVLRETVMHRVTQRLEVSAQEFVRLLKAPSERPLEKPEPAEGEAADRLYLLTRGRAEISVLVGAGRRRLGTIEAGNLFGELALFSGGRRTADVVALGDVRCWALARAGLDRLGKANPRLQIELLTLVGQALAERLRRANTEIRALSQ